MAAQYVSDQQGYPPPGKAAYPTQAADQGDQYPQSSQVYPPPSYDYKPQPVAFGTTTVVVGAQPTATTTTVSAPREERSRLATGAALFSIVLLLCGTSFIGLFCAIPAFILAIVATRTTGPIQKILAGFSIGLNVASIVCTVLVIIIAIPVYVTSTGSYRGGYYPTYSNYYYSRYIG